MIHDRFPPLASQEELDAERKFTLRFAAICATVAWAPYVTMAGLVFLIRWGLE